MRVNLDGSSPKVLLHAGLENPNGVVVPSNGDVYVVDSFYKSRKVENGETFAPSKTGKLLRVTQQTEEIEIDVQVRCNKSRLLLSKA